MQSILYDGAATGNLTMTNDHGSTQSGCQAQLTRTNSHSVDMPREGACSTSDDTNGNDFVAVNGKSPKQSLQDDWMQMVAWKENRRPSICQIPRRLKSTQPPLNFGAVEKSRIFRSAYPDPDNFEFLADLGVNTILTLVPEPLPEAYAGFIAHRAIRHRQIHVPANKHGEITISRDTMAKVLTVVMDRNNYPLLVHCNRGKHRTGCVVACFRKVQSCPIDDALDEYRDYASPKCRPDDEAFIKTYDPVDVMHTASQNDWVPKRQTNGDGDNTQSDQSMASMMKSSPPGFPPR